MRLTVRLHVRRGQARVEVGRHADALADYEAALALDPANEALVRDRDELAACLQPADAAALRQRGEARFRAGDAEGGYEAFSALLRLAAAAAASGAATAPAVSAADRLAALSNRAACAIVLERYGQAVADCDAALQLVLPECGCAGGVDAVHQWAARLGDTGAGSAEEASTTCQAVDSSSSSLPDGGKLRSAVRLLTRRGAARSYTKDYSAAIADYGAAAALLRAVGEGEKAAEVAADMSALQRLAAVGSSRGETDAAAAAAAAVPAAAAAAAGVVASS